MNVLRVCVALACLALPSLAGAQVKLSVRSGDAALKFPTDAAERRALRGLMHANLKREQAKGLTSYAYRPILRFAECVSRFDKAAAPRVLSTPLQFDESGSALSRAATANRGCAVEHGAVHPLLLRAALAETQLRQEPHGQRARGTTTPVGVPRVVDGYPIGQIAECQVRRAPQLVQDLLSTEPGESSERRAVEALFAQTAECGTANLGRLAPTAARLAVVEAEYIRRFGTITAR